MMTISDICTVPFFTELGGIVGGTCGEYITNNAKQLVVHINANYNFAVLDYFSTMDIVDIADYIATQYKTPLQKIYDSYYIEYTPTSNTQYTETETNTGVDETTISEQKTIGRTNTETNSGTDTTTANATASTDFGEDSVNNSSTTFDSTSYNPISQTNSSGKNSGNSNTSTTVEHGRKLEISDHITDESAAQHQLQHGHVVQRSRDGNIGVTPNQTLIELEFQLRLKYRMYEFIAMVLCDTLFSGVISNDN